MTLPPRLRPANRPASRPRPCRVRTASTWALITYGPSKGARRLRGLVSRRGHTPVRDRQAVAPKNLAGVALVNLHALPVTDDLGDAGSARSVRLIHPAIKRPLVVKHFLSIEPVGNLARRGLRRVGCVDQVTQSGQR